MWEKEELSSFLFEAAQNTWIVGQSSKEERNHSTTYSYEAGDWRFEDNFFGDAPAGGREVIFYKNKPVWIMSYYGKVYRKERTGEVFDVLRNAVKEGFSSEDDSCVRGPDSYTDGDYKYVNYTNGAIEMFSGEEMIFKDGEELYTAIYSGGFIE
jgi:hypothetical protein